jgi:hypothetical protein
MRHEAEAKEREGIGGGEVLPALLVSAGVVLLGLVVGATSRCY